MISRRRFLKRGTALYFVSGPYFTGRVFAEGAFDIAAIKGANTEAAVRAAVSAVGGMGAFVKKGDQVVVNPNLSFASPPSRAATTNPEVVQVILKLCLEAGAKRIVVMDHPLQDAAVIGSRAAIADIVKETKGAVLFLPVTEDLYREASIPKGKALKSTKTAKILDESDVLIKVPVAKSHSATGVSLGIKGSLGLILDRVACHNSPDLNQAIADLTTIIRPDLTIVDAVRALTTRGPQGPGKVVKLDTIVAGRDPVAADSHTVTLTPWYNRTFSGDKVKHLVLAAEMGSGEIDPSKLQVQEKTLS